MVAFGDLTGKMLGKYELRAQIGAGGMGAVYRAYQSDLKRSVAVKVLPIAFSDDRSYLDRFNREAAISASLEHAHIVPVYDYGTDRDVTYVVMRLLTGGNLSERVNARQKQGEAMPSLTEIANLLKSLASALDYAHSQQVIHRDIKPTNVMFDNQGSPFLVDFGIAKLMEATTGLTQPGQSPGTPVFMSPEQWKAEEIGPASDQYALGIMAYLLVTGRVPFDADTPYQIMHKHFYEMPTPPQAHRSDLPEAVTRVLNRVLEKEPSARFPNATDFAQAFNNAIAGDNKEATNFFVFKLPEKADDQPTYVAEREKAPTKSTLQNQPTEIIRNNVVMWGGLAVVAAVIVVVLGIILLSGGGDEDGSEKDNTNVAAVDVEGSATAIGETQNAVTARAATQNALVLPPIATETRRPTDTSSPTLDAREAALATNQVEGTINAARTEIFIENQTETATLWTETPLPTQTALPTATTPLLPTIIVPTQTSLPTATIPIVPTLIVPTTTVPTNTPAEVVAVEPTTAATEIAEVEATADSGPIEVSIWIRNADEKESILRAIADFNIAQSAYRVVETSPQGGSTDETIAAAAESGDLACIFDMDGAYVYRYIYGGNVVALDDLLSAEFMADLLPSVVDQGTVNGQFYTVGRFESGIGIWANRTFLDAAGIRIPESVEDAWTLEEFNAVLAILAETTPQPGGLVIGMNMNFASEWYSYALSPILQSFGGDIIDRETLATANGFLNSPESIAGLAWLQWLFESGYSSPSSAIGLDGAFGDGTLPLFWGGTWAYYWFEGSLGDDLVLIPMPNFGHGSVTSGGSMQWVVSSDCASPEGAAAFLEFAYQPDYLDWIVSAHGEMPPTYSLMAWFDVFQSGGVMSIFREQAEMGVTVLRPKSPVYQAISDAMYTLIVDVVYGGDPAAAANEAVETIDGAIRAAGE